MLFVSIKKIDTIELIKNKYYSFAVFFVFQMTDGKGNSCFQRHENVQNIGTCWYLLKLCEKIFFKKQNNNNWLNEQQIQQKEYGFNKFSE